MKLTLIHISDLHYLPSWPEEIGLVSKEFFKDIKLQIKELDKTFVAFSGDIVQSGVKSNYNDFMAQFAQHFDGLGISFNNRICTPGNHDISRDALKSSLLMQNSTICAINTEEIFNDHILQLSETIFNNKFSEYVEFEKDFAKYTCCQSTLGGTGWDLGEGIGIYCLNSALCSSGGLNDPKGNEISDKKSLHIDTRSLYRWLENTNASTKILIMHHPIDWLSDWAEIELEKIINKNFQLVLSGHNHRDSAKYSIQSIGNTLQCSAPPLFTRKSGELGYALINIDTESDKIEVIYRQWASSKNIFVSGTNLAGNDNGTLIFSTIGDNIQDIVSPNTCDSMDTLGILQAEFDEATTCYSSKRKVWVDRDLANTPENVKENENTIITKLSEFCNDIRSCIIRSPRQFGLTCLGRYIALEHHRLLASDKAIAMVDTLSIKPDKKNIIKHLNNRCIEMHMDYSSIAGIILDNWHGDKSACMILKMLQEELPTTPIIILQNNDDCTDIVNALDMEIIEKFETLYLWALSRSRIRELVCTYTKHLSNLDDSLVTKKVIDDIDALNIHRTPLNCLLILKLAEQAFDDSPVNRTEMIGRVLYLLFYQYDKIPRYATRPDLKDCEYALGYVCEWLVRGGKKSFTKNEFYDKVQEYCKIHILELDREVLFTFLVTENIFIRKGTDFKFRFSYWLYFFAAHRMHHDSSFAKYILSERRYSAYPEIVEFYTGIDRRRIDAVEILTQDLDEMNSSFTKRTGIPEDFNPYQDALWNPSDKAIEEMKKTVDASVAESSLPVSVKDTIADKNYDRSRPYHQELAQFLDESTFVQMINAMKGAARALRNSDHVTPEAKMKLLEAVLSCWTRVCQILVVLSPLLAEKKRVNFEGMDFYLTSSFDPIEDIDTRWNCIMAEISDNVVRWYQEDIFSKKLGALFAKNIEINRDTFKEFLLLMVLTKQRPSGWENVVESFIDRTHKNSFYLSRIQYSLQNQYVVGFTNEQTRQQLRRLAAMSIAKHCGSKKPNNITIEKVAKKIDLNTIKADSPKIGGQYLDRKKRKEKRLKRKSK